MNNRIQELAEEALRDPKSLITDDVCRPTGHMAWASKPFADKFAELIVKEMCDMMEQTEDDCYHCIDASERPLQYIEWLYDWRKRFEEHFGMK